MREYVKARLLCENGVKLDGATKFKAPWADETGCRQRALEQSNFIFDGKRVTLTVQLLCRV
ncbi:hypothetical protein AN191_00080 [Loktanella sp. 5RATIMAR09]|nr:hypothetical protein AN191_00080 [Loktanella sp. 5RATIMAR09]